MIEFLDDFPGIGPKYARNIMMDCYHPLFQNCIAIDARIKSVSKQLELNFDKYSEYEHFYLSAAKKAGIDGWEMDRLIWKHIKIFLDRLKTPQE
jgi:endonuclease III